MIHKTARDYLLGTPGENRPFNVDRSAAHKQMFLSSMRCLMSTGLRASLSRDQKPELLEYAASSWSSHLLSSPPLDQDVISTLKKFLSGTWVLTWIHALAVMGKLRILVGVSKDLSKFASRAHQKGIEGKSVGIADPEHELFESCAADLLRIVGKFGALLRRKPDSIYKSIPPFCPKSSWMYQVFGKSEGKSLSVTGLLAETWDDSLARIPIGTGPGTFASSILAAGSQVAVLASSGSVFLHDSSDFRASASSPIKHGERVDRMQLNTTATLLATYGYRTTKVWNVSTGSCLVSVESIESKTRPLAMLFTKNNSTLLVGTDDRRVRSLNLNESQPEWQIVAQFDEVELEGHFMNSATHVALSKDGSMAAVAYRSHPLSAWETDGPVHIGHCWRKDETVAIRELRELVWHPHIPEILGLNVEGVVFRWSPYDGEVDELSAAATKLSISRDGDLFATGDSHGRVKLYTTSTFTLLYQLASQDAVFGLTFSPDSRRFYDIRGYYANAWEPNALLRFADQSGRDTEMSETESLSPSSEASVAISGAVDSITSLAGSPRGRLYCSGTERGVVSLHETRRGKIADIHVSRAKFTIEKTIWSQDGKYICFTDTSKQITVLSVAPGAGEAAPTVEQKATVSMRKFTKGLVLQLLFRPDSTHVLVHTSSRICAVSLASSTVEHSRDLEEAHLKWIVHPQDPTLIVGFGKASIHIFDWNLVECQRSEISWPIEAFNGSDTEDTPGSDTYETDLVLVSHDKKHILLQISCSRGSLQSKKFFYFEAAAISVSVQSQGRSTPQATFPRPPPIVPCPLSPELSSRIAMTLSFLSRNRLVFLSKDFAICAVQLPWAASPLSPRSLPRVSGAVTTSTKTAPSRQTARNNIEDKTQELFALPGDWISRNCLLVCSIWGVERSLLCPRNGEAAMIRSSALF